jgi:murein DD-endopeptidase MepM/ murein hydrolase activator NlpD
VSEERLALTRRAARPWSLGGLFGLFLVLVIGLTPAIAASGPKRAPGDQNAGSGRRTSTQRVTSDAKAQAAAAGVSAQALPITGPRSVTLGLTRLFTTQFDGSPYANGNCNMAAGAMLFEVQTGRTVTGAQMRRWSRARTSGTTLMDLRRAFQSQGQWVQIAEDMRWETFTAAVRSGRSAVVQGWYGNLRDNVLQAGFTTAHSVFVLGYSRNAKNGRGAFYVMDPLGGSGYDGAWWSRQELKRFGWGGRPDTIGTGRTAYYGNVAMQSAPTPKNLHQKAYRPAFQSYWDTSKELMQRARRVDLVPRRVGQSPFVLKVDDPRLTLTPRASQRRPMARPVKGWKQSVISYRVDDKRLIVRTKDQAKVVAAAAGRVIFRGWTFSGSRYVWIQHGRRLFTIYRNLASVGVEPGQWVKKGQVIGKVVVETKKTKKGKVRVGNLKFMVAVGSPRATTSRAWPMPYLGGKNGKLP